MNTRVASFMLAAREAYAKAYERHHGVPPDLQEDEHAIQPIAEALNLAFMFGADVGPAMRGPTIAQIRANLARLDAPHSAPPGAAPSVVNAPLPGAGGGDA